MTVTTADTLSPPPVAVTIVERLRATRPPTQVSEKLVAPVGTVNGVNVGRPFRIAADEVKLTLKPFGAGPLKVTVQIVTPLPTIVLGLKVIPATATPKIVNCSDTPPAALLLVPGAAKIVTTSGGLAGEIVEIVNVAVVLPAKIVTVEALSTAVVGSLLEIANTRPPAGAAFGIVIVPVTIPAGPG